MALATLPESIPKIEPIIIDMAIETTGLVIATVLIIGIMAPSTACIQ